MSRPERQDYALAETTGQRRSLQIASGLSSLALMGGMPSTTLRDDMAATRWLFYTINDEGVGHLTRQLALARQLRKRAPEAEYLFFTSCEAVSLAWQEGFASIKMPSHSSVKVAHLRPETRVRLLHTITPSVIACYDPHILVVDTVPGGTLTSAYGPKINNIADVAFTAALTPDLEASFVSVPTT